MQKGGGGAGLRGRRVSLPCPALTHHHDCVLQTRRATSVLPLSSCSAHCWTSTARTLSLRSVLTIFSQACTSRRERGLLSLLSGPRPTITTTVTPYPPPPPTPSQGGYAALRSAAKKPPGDVVAMTPKRCLAFLQLRPSPVESPGGSTFNNYIIDAKRNIRKCAEACSCWTSPYDGSSVADALSNGGGGLTTNFHDATASSSSPASVISSPAAADSRRQSFGGAGAGGRAGGLFANLKSKIMTARAAPSPSAPSPVRSG